MKTPLIRFKTLLIVFGVVCAASLLAYHANAASVHVAPKPHVVMKSEHIRLGDVFEGVSKHADFVLAPAPAPGEETVWNRPTLIRIATAFNLPWKAHDNSEVRITREGYVVDEHTIRSVIRDHLVSDTGHALYDIRFTGEAPALSVSGNAAPMLDLADFSRQVHSGQFSAIIKATLQDGTEHNVNVRGVAERQERVPVLRSSLRNGQLISARDIDYIVMRASSLKAGTILEPEALIGSTPKRNLNQHVAVRVDDIELPRMVSRGEIVTMVYAQGGMRLTAKGKALSDGASGDIIRVSNLNTNRMLEARVTNFREVNVQH